MHIISKTKHVSRIKGLMQKDHRIAKILKLLTNVQEGEHVLRWVAREIQYLQLFTAHP